MMMKLLGQVKTGRAGVWYEKINLNKYRIRTDLADRSAAKQSFTVSDRTEVLPPRIDKRHFQKQFTQNLYLIRSKFPSLSLMTVIIMLEVLFLRFDFYVKGWNTSIRDKCL